MISNKDTFHLNSDQAERVNKLALTRPNKSAQEIVTMLIERGLYAVEHRAEYEKQKRDDAKRGKAITKIINSGRGILEPGVRDIAVKLGMVVSDEE